MNVAAIIGVPGTGKTTLMWRIMTMLGGAPPYRNYSLGTARGHMFSRGPTLVMGRYDPGDVYAGTDRLSMSVQAHALEAVSRWRAKDPKGVVMFEGDRLTNSSFFEALLAQGHNLQITVLAAGDSVRLQRFAERGSTQTERFLKGRDTKIANLMERYPHSFEAHLKRQDTERLAEKVISAALGIKSTKALD